MGSVFYQLIHLFCHSSIQPFIYHPSNYPSILLSSINYPFIPLSSIHPFIHPFLYHPFLCAYLLLSHLLSIFMLSAFPSSLCPPLFNNPLFLYPSFHHLSINHLPVTHSSSTFLLVMLLALFLHRSHPSFCHSSVYPFIHPSFRPSTKQTVTCQRRPLKL